VPTSLNLREEIAEAPFGRFHVKFAALMSLIMLFDGYELFNAAYVIPLVRSSWHPSPSMIGVMLSSGIVGLSIGAVVQGLIADRIGRRTVMLLALWLLTGASLLLATIVDSPVSFSVCRLLLGCALGMITPLALTCINEWAPRKQANTYANWVFQFGFSMGGISAGIAGIWLTPHFGWQSLYYLGALSFLAAIAATLWLPESLQFLALNHRDDEIAKILAQMRPGRARAYRGAYFEMPTENAPRGSIVALLAPRYRRNTIVLWIVGFLGLFSIHGLTGWLPTLVVAQGQAVSSAFGYGTLVMVAAIFGSLFMGWIADRLGSRTRAMSIGYGIAALSMAGLAYFLGSANGVTLVLVAATGFFIFGAHAVLNNYQAMTYGTEVRSTGVGVAQALSRVGGILGPLIVGWVASVEPSPVYTFMMFAGGLLLASIVVTFGGAALSSPAARANEPLQAIDEPA
jgi:AAHS family benzoate transporter-like MFS transporter